MHGDFQRALWIILGDRKEGRGGLPSPAGRETWTPGPRLPLLRGLLWLWNLSQLQGALWILQGQSWALPLTAGRGRGRAA